VPGSRRSSSSSFPSLSPDLWAVVGVVVLTDALVVTSLVQNSVLWVVGVLFVVFVPGYACTAALFPERGGTDSRGTRQSAVGKGGRSSLGSTRTAGIDGVERAVLSVGLSIAVVPLTAIGLDIVGVGPTLVPVVVVVSVVSLLAVGVAAVRRGSLPANRRYGVNVASLLPPGAGLTDDTTLDTALDVFVAVSLVVAAASAGYVVAFGSAEGDTELYLLSQKESGELEAGSYPEVLEQSRTEPLTLGVDNHEGESVAYTVVVKLQRTQTTGESATVVEERELRRFVPTVEDGGTWTTTYGVTPTMTGDDVRLAVLLYRGEAPQNPTLESAYRATHLWVEVTRSEG
jgi:uncharacterized membrane protein